MLQIDVKIYRQNAFKLLKVFPAEMITYRSTVGDGYGRSCCGCCYIPGSSYLSTKTIVRIHRPPRTANRVAQELLALIPDSPIDMHEEETLKRQVTSFKFQNQIPNGMIN